jgi:PTS system fructose-specific IIC component
MKIEDITTTALVHLDVAWSSKDEVIANLIASLVADGAVSDDAGFRQAVSDREAQGPTGLQDGLAIPHGKSEVVTVGRVAMARLSTPIADWESVTPGNAVDLVFLLAIPDTESGTTHLKALSVLSRRFMDDDARESFMSATTPEEFIAALVKAPADTERPLTATGLSAPAQPSATRRPTILAITSCAAGIAHTYMAAQALEKAGAELGIDVYVEKQGALGIEDAHTPEQIASADAVIFAIDTVAKGRERYAGKPYVQTKVSEPLRRAPELLKQVLSHPDGVVAQASSESPLEADAGAGSTLGEMGRALLTGISYMIPVIVAAGLMMGLAKLTWQYGLGLDVTKMGSKTPAEWGGFREFLVSLDMFGALIFKFMYPVFAMYVAYGIAGRVGLVGGLTGGVFAAGIHNTFWGNLDAIPSGFLGALIMGLGAGYLARWLNLHIKVPTSFVAIKPMLLIPGISVLVLFTANFYAFDPFFGWLNKIIYDLIAGMPIEATLAMSAVIAAATAFDLGGPVNKAAGAVAIGMAADGVFPLTPRVLAIVIPAMGIGLAVILDKYLLHRHLYDGEEEIAGQGAFLLSFLGISEGAIPFMLRNPLYVIPINIVGAIFGSCLAVALGAVQWLPLPAIWGWPLVQTNLWAYLIGMLAGASLIATLYTLVRIRLKRKHEEVLAVRHTQLEAEEILKQAAVGAEATV